LKDFGWHNHLVNACAAQPTKQAEASRRRTVGGKEKAANTLSVIAKPLGDFAMRGEPDVGFALHVLDHFLEALEPHPTS
jgi:hypothetical protein